MRFWRRFKTKFLDFEHPPKPSAVAMADAFLVIVILLSYAMVQHVIPAHFISGRISAYRSRHPITVESSAVPAPVIVSTPAPTSTPKPAGELTLAEKFAEKFSDSVEITDHSYRSPDVSVEIIEHMYEEGNHLQHWYEADIYTSDIFCLQTYVHDDSDGQAGNSMLLMAELSRSVAAINGDYAVTTDSGVIVRNGEVLRESPGTAQICVMFRDGSVKCFAPDEYDSESVMKKGVWQAWTFGPSLLDEKGKALTSFPAYYGNVLENNPRTVLGYYEPGHYCFVVIDGRQPGYSTGTDMAETAKLMEGLGCKVAFNLDGGRSSQMTFGSEFANHPYNDGRYVGDIVIVKDIFEQEETK